MIENGIDIILTEDAIKYSVENPQIDFRPTRSTKGSAGYDVRACIPFEVVIKVGECIKIPLGFRAYVGSLPYVGMPNTSVAALALPRSGLGARDGIVLGNLVGLIDPDYQEEWVCAIWNRNLNKPIVIEPGMRIAQCVFMPVFLPEFVDVEEFSSVSERIGGFGSTGVA